MVDKKNKGCSQCENPNLKGIHTCLEKRPKKKSDNGPDKMWLIIGNEELPLGIAVAKTPGGAKNVYMRRTGKNRDLVHVEELKFHKKYTGFTPLT